MMRNRVISLLVAVMALLLLQEKGDADGSDPLSQLAGVSESLAMCPVEEELCYEPFDAMAAHHASFLLSSAYQAIHSSGSLRLSHVRRGLTGSQTGRDLMVKSLLPQYASRLNAWTRCYFHLWQREVRYYICLRNLRI